ncbi:NAD(P)H-binding protein [Nonomuraea sp. NPDC050536]|uniref:NAD(P)H-binding protein n=1 Tax=Nonomuraea sp. NPDC050536 TaxID=3364366 RepID=UPI0037C77325
MSRILVTGATGNVGKHVFSTLAEAGLDVRALVRNPEKVPGDAVRGDLTDPGSIDGALRDVESVFLVWPGFEASAAAPVIERIARHARRIVYLSASHGTAFHQGVEGLIRQTGLSWTFLRPGGFAANTLGWAAQIREGVVRWPYGQARRALIHEKDIAAVAVHTLTSAGHGGAAYELSGPAVISQEDQVRTIGEVVGRQVRWEDLSPEVAREHLLAAWGDPGFVDTALETWKAFVTSPEEVTATVERLLGRPALTFRQWAEDHADDFR